ncbi:LysM peptidoglycan-binding domain-containing protein [Aquibacillus halophilus]|uniref:LysM peptidoglycan-binding domain-containing protein n=1 Tax=Aquibacillus halophilus TaxID=930132 RepID=A0A6A8DBP4_9BACI|nr:LysM peptidoglycan-binding domain-containing protein [Aquibacillus halophilus]MRH41279.1 LysM peptidoglycan-binding domain-containing protein [Aquibacillus halophilus]
MKKTNKTLLTVVATLAIATGFSTKAEAASYTVQSGDSLWSIAQKHNTSVANLKSINNLSTNNIYINQRLETSRTATTGSYYTVKYGDSLWAIASKHGVSVANLKSWNNKSTNTLYVGETLAVSGSTTSQPVQKITAYKVSSGDSLFFIAKRYSVSVSNLKSWNSLSSNTIYAGQVLQMQEASQSAPAPVKQEASYAEKLVAEAKSHVGTPYLWAGTAPGGFDCSGFIYYVHNKVGETISRTSAANYYNQATKVSNPEVGDLVFFSDTYKPGISHMGIYVGNGEFVHASSSGVTVSKVNSSYWGKYFTGYGKF